MQHKFAGTKLGGGTVCGKEHHSSLHGSKSQYCKSMSINVQMRRSSNPRTVRTITCSIFAVYSVQIWNLPHASPACLCKVFWAGVKFHLKTKPFLTQICFLVYKALIQLSLLYSEKKIIISFCFKYNHQG